VGGLTGADAHRWNIDNCNTTVMHWGDPLIQEPGNVVGPTIQGIEALIARIPPRAGTTQGTLLSTARTLALVSKARGSSQFLCDPPYYDAGKRMGRYADLKVAN
jgi:hypothetical protein